MNDRTSSILAGTLVVVFVIAAFALFLAFIVVLNRFVLVRFGLYLSVGDALISCGLIWIGNSLDVIKQILNLNRRSR